VYLLESSERGERDGGTDGRTVLLVRVR
jgi:hypothetical protein